LRPRKDVAWELHAHSREIIRDLFLNNFNQSSDGKIHLSESHRLSHNTLTDFLISQNHRFNAILLAKLLLLESSLPYNRVCFLKQPLFRRERDNQASMEYFCNRSILPIVRISWFSPSIKGRNTIYAFSNNNKRVIDINVANKSLQVA